MRISTCDLRFVGVRRQKLYQPKAGQPICMILYRALAIRSTLFADGELKDPARPRPTTACQLDECDERSPERDIPSSSLDLDEAASHSDSLSGMTSGDPSIAPSAFELPRSSRITPRPFCSSATRRYRTPAHLDMGTERMSMHFWQEARLCRAMCRDD